MSLKLIKQAQLKDVHGDILAEAEHVKRAIGATELDSSIVQAALTLTRKRKLAETTDFGAPMEPDYLLDQIMMQADEHGLNPHNLSVRQFNMLAQEMFGIDEEEYGVRTTPGERRALVAAARQMYDQRRQTGFRSPEENEERGWPSDYNDAAPEDDPRADEYEMMNDPEFQRELNEPWDDEQEDGFDDEGNWIGDAENHPDYAEMRAQYDRERPGYDDREAYEPRDPEHPDWMQENEEVSQEYRGWRDCKAGRPAKFPSDTEYMKGYDNARALSKRRGGAQENEETTSKQKESFLKSLLSQRKQVAAKASEIMKKFEEEGAAAFHEFRMKNEKSPYAKDKPEEHAAWTKGWMKAASAHYTLDESDVKKKPKPKSKQGKK